MRRENNTMQKKQLDFDQPLLSVRRFSSKLISSKDANKKKTEKSLLSRQQSLPVCKSDWQLEQVTKPAAVPFMWEKIPGKAKVQNPTPLEPSNTPRLPPRRTFDGLYPHEKPNTFKPKIDVPPLNNEISALWESLKKRSAEGSEGDDYSDACDTLCPIDTVSMKCSESGLSGHGCCENFSANAQTKDFMMKRFLPAAKAVVLDTTQYVPKKQPMAPDRSRPVKKAVSGEIKQFHEQIKSVAVSHYVKHKEERGSEEDDMPVDTGKKTVKAFGLFSRFCLKNPLCLLNPVPGMKARTQVHTSAKDVLIPPSPSAKGANRMARTSHSGLLTQTAEKNASGAVYKHKLVPRSHSQELHKVQHKPSGGTNRLSYSGDLHMMKGAFRDNISPYRNTAPPSIHQICNQVSGSMTPAVESTDSINIVNKPVNDSVSSGMNSLDGGKDFSTPESLVQELRSVDDEPILKEDDEGHPIVGFMLSPLPPPLPKSPSESWLWKTLPSIAMWHQKKQLSKDSDMDTKWETIVKISNAHHDHARYSEELGPRVSQHSKT